MVVVRHCGHSLLDHRQSLRNMLALLHSLTHVSGSEPIIIMAKGLVDLLFVEMLMNSMLCHAIFVAVKLHTYTYVTKPPEEETKAQTSYNTSFDSFTCW